MTLFKTRLNLSEDVRTEMIEILNVQVANLSMAQWYIKFSHWNVKGEGFYPTHLLFDKVYKSAVDATDDIAEWIGSLGGIAEGKPEVITEHATIPPYEATGSDDVMTHIESMSTLIAFIVDDLRTVSDKCNKLGDSTSASYISDIAEDLQHKLYFLEAHLR